MIELNKLDKADKNYSYTRCNISGFQELGMHFQDLRLAQIWFWFLTSMDTLLECILLYWKGFLLVIGNQVLFGNHLRFVYVFLNSNQSIVTKHLQVQRRCFVWRKGIFDHSLFCKSFCHLYWKIPSWIWYWRHWKYVVVPKWWNFYGYYWGTS